MKYRKKPVVIDAVQFNGNNGKEIEEFTNGAAREIATNKPLILVQTPSGEVRAWVGVWIIKGVTGEVYPCKPDVFAQTYEAVEDDA